MKIRTIAVAVVCGLFFTLLMLAAGCSEPVETEGQDLSANPMPEADLVKRGEYLVNSIGCHDCHTPKKFTEHGPEPDLDRALMGYPAGSVLPEFDPKVVEGGKWAMLNSDLTAAVGLWGVSFAANLTSDPTGIGLWKEENFIKSIREGKLKGIDGSRPLLPPMPWPFYRNLSDEDLKAIFAYLKTIKPINNVVPAPITPDKLASLTPGE
jgi:mono/diheme cytochrome c family protein